MNGYYNEISDTLFKIKTYYSELKTDENGVKFMFVLKDKDGFKQHHDGIVNSSESMKEFRNNTKHLINKTVNYEQKSV